MYLKRQHFNNWFSISSSTYQPQFKHSLKNVLKIQVSVAQSCLTLCNPIDDSPLGSSVPGILQARTLEWVAISFSSAWKWKVKVKSLSCAWLLATPWTAAYQAPPSMGFSRQVYWSGLPLPSPWYIYLVPEILQVRILEWVAFLFSRGSSQPRDQTQVSCTVDWFFTSWATREAQEYWSG